MDKKTCDVVQDLMVLYEDDVCSEESKKIIEEHIETCEDCKKIYNYVQKKVPSVTMIEEAKQDKKVIKGVKKNLFIKKVLLMAVPLIALILIYVIGAYARFTTPQPIVDLYELEDGKILCTAAPPHPYAYTMSEGTYFGKDSRWHYGPKPDKAYFYFTYTFWDMLKSKMGYMVYNTGGTQGIIFDPNDGSYDEISYGYKGDSEFNVLWKKGDKLTKAPKGLQEKAEAMMLLDMNQVELLAPGYSLDEAGEPEMTQEETTEESTGSS